MSGKASSGNRGRTELDRDAFVELSFLVDALQRQHAEVLKPLELTLPQFNVLRALEWAGEPVTVGYVAASLITKSPDITRMLDRIERQGWIERIASGNDRRSVLVQLTAAGRALHEQAGQMVDACNRRQWAAFDDKELAQVVQWARRARVELGDLCPPDSAST